MRKIIILQARRGAAGRAVFFKVAGTISWGKWRSNNPKVTPPSMIFLFWYVEHTFTEVVNTLVGKGVVVVLPRELGLDVALGSQRLHGLDDFKVGNINVGVLRGVEVLGSNQGTVYNLELDSLSKFSSRKMSYPWREPRKWPFGFAWKWACYGNVVSNLLPWKFVGSIHSSIHPSSRSSNTLSVMILKHIDLGVGSTILTCGKRGRSSGRRPSSLNWTASRTPSRRNLNPPA